MPQQHGLPSGLKPLNCLLPKLFEKNVAGFSTWHTMGRDCPYPNITKYMFNIAEHDKDLYLMVQGGTFCDPEQLYTIDVSGIPKALIMLLQLKEMKVLPLYN